MKKNLKVKYEKVCAVCGANFESSYKRRTICSPRCKKEKINLKRRFRSSFKKPTCFIPHCKFHETLDVHYEGKEVYWLCPSHHALITRGIKCLSEIVISAERAYEAILTLDDTSGSLGDLIERYSPKVKR